MEIRRSCDRLISTVGFPILVRRHHYIESGPRGFPMGAFLVKLSLVRIWNLGFWVRQQIKPPLSWGNHFSWIIPNMLARFPVRWHQPTVAVDILSTSPPSPRLPHHPTHHHHGWNGFIRWNTCLWGNCCGKVGWPTLEFLRHFRFKSDPSHKWVISMFGPIFSCYGREIYGTIVCIAIGTYCLK